MNKDILMKLYNTFNEYVVPFYGYDTFVNQNIKLKQNHTLRVCKIAKDLAASLNLSQSSALIAETSALFHDIGRFEQFKTYKTFSDKASINHANLGIEIIDSLNLLKDLSEGEKNFVITAIKYHNAKDVPEAITGEGRIFCNILRDSDKLDIFYVISQYEKEKAAKPNPALADLPIEKGYSKEIATSILKSEKVSYELIKNNNDRRLLELGWILDINFPYSIKYYDKHEYLETFVAYLPRTKEMDQIYKHLKSYIKKRLSLRN